MTKELEHLLSKERLKKLGFLSLVKIYTQMSMCWSGVIKKMEQDTSQWYQGKEQEAMGINSNIVNSNPDWTWSWVTCSS